jgi:FkbM family methyltransferase
MRIEPQAASVQDLRRYVDRRSLLLETGVLLTRYLPRAKGWAPRKLGQLLGKGATPVMRTACGALLAVDASYLDVYTTMRCLKGPSEPDVIRACLSVLKSGDVFYDIGANAGYVSIELSHLLGGALRVYAFEPIGSLAKAAACSAALNGFDNVLVFPAMVGNEDRVGDLFIGSHSVHASRVAREAGSSAVPTPMVTLDTVVRDGVAPPPRLIKIDVEGGEFDVLRGAQVMLGAHRPYILFECDFNIQRWGYSRAEIYKYVREAGYELFAIGPDSEAFVHEREGHPESTLPNVLAVPREFDPPTLAPKPRTN